MVLVEQEVFHIVEMVWLSILNLPIEQSREEIHVSSQGYALARCVHIRGAWNGTIVLCCSDRLAHKAAAVMFSDEAGQEPLDKVYDAVGELANMVGGNLKALLPGPSQLSVPAPIENSDYQDLVRDAQPQNRLAFQCDGEPFLIAIFERPVEYSEQADSRL